MKNLKKGFIVPLLIAIIAVLAIGGGILIYKESSHQETVLPSLTSTSTSTLSLVSTSTPTRQNQTAPKTESVSGLKTYTDVSRGISFQYPVTWTYQKFSCNLDGVAFYSVDDTTLKGGVTCGMNSPVAPIYFYPKPEGQSTNSSSLILSTQFANNDVYKTVYSVMTRTFKTSAGSISSTQLAGVWQNSSVMASGWSTLYQFFPSGKYNYKISSMQCSSRDIGHSGYWKIVGDTIQLTEMTKTNIVGCNLQCGPSGGIMDGTTQTIKLNSSNAVKVQLNITQCKNAEVSYYSCLNISGFQFYQFSKDPTYNNDSELQKEPVF